MVFCYCMEGPDRQAVWDRRWMKAVMERRSMLHSNSQCLQQIHPVSSHRTRSVVPQTHIYEPPKKYSTSPLFSLMLGRLRDNWPLCSSSALTMTWMMTTALVEKYDLLWIPVLVQRLVNWACYLVLAFFNLAWPISVRTNATLNALLALLPTPRVGKV